MIDKETFIDTINFLEALYKRHKSLYDESLGSEFDFMYEIKLTIKNFTKILGLFFPNPLYVTTYIEFYCFCLNFGKISPEAEYFTPGELYEDLLN